MNISGTINRLKRGFTLIEIGIVLSVVGLIIAAVWQVMGNARESQKESDAIEEEQVIANGIAGFMQGRSFAAALISNPINNQMITAQAVPPSYLNTTSNAIDNPWDDGAPDTAVVINGVTTYTHANKGVEIYAMNAKTFRVAFYNVTYAGCVSLLTQQTACDIGQQGCPIEAYTDWANKNCLPNTGCSVGAASAGVGWQVMGATQIAAMCSANSYTGGENSVEFDYSL